ncbi:MAG: tRNA-ribosyltransferase family protein [Patescibacteria group bacterium]
MKSITIKNKAYDFPIFLPDATRAVTKSIDSNDMVFAEVRGCVVNTYHLMSEPGVSVLKHFGGIKGFMKFDGLVVSDSGGWQVFSLIHRNKKAGTITDKGVTFSLGGAKKKLFTPEKSIQVQMDIGSDIVICLDDFSPPEGDDIAIEESVVRTTKWAKRCREEFDRQCEVRKLDDSSRPHLFAVVQGARSKPMRDKSATELREIGFDGYGFGGYLIDEEGNLDLDMMEYLASIIPNDLPKFALGTGSPHEIAMCYQLGWDIFDCTLPTRDARHQRLYVFTEEPNSVDALLKEETYGYVQIKREKYRRDERPISDFCDCYTCKNYSRAYLQHLFSIKDTSAFRLATIHNLWTYNKLISLLSK